MQAAVAADAVLAILHQLSHDIRDLDVGSAVDRHARLPVVQFLRDYVAANKPVLLTSVVKHWPAYQKWTDEYLCSVAGDTEVTVALTPNGRADAVTPLYTSTNAGGSNSASSSSGSGGASSAAAGDSPHVANGCRANGGDSSSGTAAAAAAEQVAQQFAKCSMLQQELQDQQQQAPQAECFALPHQQKMPLRNFLSLLRTTRGSQGGCEGQAGAPPVPYLQYQNSSLTAEVPQLLGDVDLLLSWATEAFNGLPEAVNLWIGDERSVTSWHKDPYENIYAVVAGCKTFSLLPPSDVYRMRLRRYRQATYTPASSRNDPGSGGGDGGCSVGSCGSNTCSCDVNGAVPLLPQLHASGEEVLWSSLQPAVGQQPRQAAAAAGGDAAGEAAAGKAAAAAAGMGLFDDPLLPPPLRVTVKAGEVLYLPALWWHQVEQEPDESGRVIAVNYWYDMKFDARQAHFQAVERLAELLGLNQAPPPPPPPPAQTRSD